jgi:hypothetical protein
VSAVSQNKQLEIINIPRRDILGVAYSDFLQSYFGVVLSFNNVLGRSPGNEARSL